MSVLETIVHQLSTKFIGTLTTAAAKASGASKNNSSHGISSSSLYEVDDEAMRQALRSEASLHVMLHQISSARSLRDFLDASHDQNNNSNRSKSSNNNSGHATVISSVTRQLFQPLLNSMLALFGKLLMDSFTMEPKVTEAVATTGAYRILGRHILTLFPEMVHKQHKTSGKLLISHVVLKARPTPLPKKF